MNVATRRLLEEQIADVAVPGRGEKNDALWHVPKQFHSYTVKIIRACGSEKS